MLKSKLLAIVDLNKLRLYKAQGIKVIEKIEELPLEVEKTHRHEKGSFKKTSNPSSAFEPHTSASDIIHEQAAKIVANHLDKMMTNNGQDEYGELMLAAEPKTLGHIRGQLSNKVKKMVSKEIVKDLAHHQMHEIEHIFFS